MDQRTHWDNVYKTKHFHEVSWYQSTPRVSLDFIKELGIDKNKSIIDVGGGDSLLVDHLLKHGYTDITILDISEAAIKRAKSRLGKNAKKVNWIVSDVTEFSTEKKFDCWHDRAAFHFLTTEEQVEKYLSVAQKHISENGRMIIGTFSTKGPEKCSGLPVKQYSEQSLSSVLKKWFDKIKCITTDHVTPSNKIQNFLFCSFKKINFQ
jgi:2-polyprenyl-3-methyl-5-hydroxy-6-metoxy-1,4-benzoquinol methylase